MTIQDIISHSWQPVQLYQSIHITSISDAAFDELTIGAIKKEFGYDYAKTFVHHAVDKICNSYKRKDPMAADERADLADAIVSRKEYLTASDIKLFVQMLINNELLTGKGGAEDGRLIVVETSAIMEKLNAYERKRDIVVKRRFGTGETNSESDTKMKCNDWMKSHDAYGTEMPRGWDYMRYWFNYNNTHLIDGSIAPANFNPLRYWKQESPSLEEVERIANKILGFKLKTV